MKFYITESTFFALTLAPFVESAKLRGNSMTLDEKNKPITMDAFKRMAAEEANRNLQTFDELWDSVKGDDFYANNPFDDFDSFWDHLNGNDGSQKPPVQNPPVQDPNPPTQPPIRPPFDIPIDTPIDTGDADGDKNFEVCMKDTDQLLALNPNLNRATEIYLNSRDSDYAGFDGSTFTFYNIITFSDKAKDVMEEACADAGGYFDVNVGDLSCELGCTVSTTKGFAQCLANTAECLAKGNYEYLAAAYEDQGFDNCVAPEHDKPPQPEPPKPDPPKPDPPKPDPTPPGLGLCQDSDDCAALGLGFCSEFGYCLSFGSCQQVDDCANPDNEFVMPRCKGSLTCSAGVCGFDCIPPKDEACQDSGDCDVGEYCGSNGTCLAFGTCGDSNDCNKGNYCSENGTCLPVGSPGDSPIVGSPVDESPEARKPVTGKPNKTKPDKTKPDKNTPKKNKSD